MTIGTKAQSFTVTSDHLIAGALKARLEYRLDTTDGDFFTKYDGTPTDTQSDADRRPRLQLRRQDLSRGTGRARGAAHHGLLPAASAIGADEHRVPCASRPSVRQMPPR